MLPAGAGWAEQLAFVAGWGDDAYGMGLGCLEIAKALGGPGHIYRQTDREAKAPFDSYHYRIIYQTFYGMRNIAGPLSATRGTAVLPFQYAKLPTAKRVVVESCPSCTLKRLGLPHQRYKQPEGGPLTAVRRRTRHAILDGLADHIAISKQQRRAIMRNPGGDALDAAIAAVGAAHGFASADHRAVRRHPRYPREGRLYV